jgi:hypothetical protein
VILFGPEDIVEGEGAGDCQGNRNCGAIRQNVTVG